MKIDKDALRERLKNMLDEAYTSGRHNELHDPEHTVEETIQAIERSVTVAVQEERDRHEPKETLLEQKVHTIVGVIDAVCRAHGVALSHEDGQGRFEIVECEERSQGFDGAISLVWADGTRKYL